MATEPETEVRRLFENKIKALTDWEEGRTHKMSHGVSDTELLDWMIFYSGRVHCSDDGEYCWVNWFSSDEEAGDAGECETAIFHDAREAIREAMKQEAGATSKPIKATVKEEKLLATMYEAWTALIRLGWNEPRFFRFPQRGEEFELIEFGSTGIHRAVKHVGSETCWVDYEWPSNPCLLRRRV